MRAAAGADSRTQRLDHYLAAAEGAVRDHPYAGVLPGDVPPLATVYVRQLVRREVSGSGGAAGAQAPAGLRPAGELLAQTDTCVVVAGPTGGGSSLLRTYLADIVAGWRAGKAGPVLAVLVPASALLGAPLADALAKYCRTRVQPSPPYQETTTAGSGHEPLLGYQDPVGAPGRLGPAGAPSPAPRPFPGTSPVSHGTAERHSDSSSRKRWLS
ncbi:hypothetical protein [Streptomyces sp. NRRL S-1022]|uniref:hypothetical protein n=1 Tax=Streptomyces sp. NRRL S-1022 TaxID=1463880 RepID=UPI0004BF7958|nr:hypothetical protein [Streptomyces sp. NRRL S-1022]